MKRLLWLVLLLVTGLGIAQAQDKVVVGVLAPLTGFAAADGQSAVTSIKLAAAKINAAGGMLGKPIELKIYNDQADPKQAVNFARRLLEQDHARLVVGASYSGATLAAAAIVNDAKVPMMAAYAVAPKITAGHPYVFRVGLMGPVEGREGALLAQHLKARRVAVLTIQNDFGQALESGFRAEAGKLGLKIVFHDAYALGNKNFTSLLVRVKSARPDVIYASGYYAEAASLVRQARSLGIRAPIIGQDGYDSPKFIELAGPAANGVYLTTQLDRDSKQGDVQAFLKAYRIQAGKPADMVGATAYAALNTLAKAVAQAGTLEGDAVRQTLAKMHNVDTVVGHIYQWNDNGDPIKTGTVQVVRKGAFHRYLNVTDRALLTP